MNPQVPDLTVDTYAAVLDGLTQQLTAAKQTQTEAFQSLQTLKAQLDGYNEFYTGLTAYTGGVDQLNAGAAQLNGSMPRPDGRSIGAERRRGRLYEGLQTLDQEGLQTLTSMVNDEWKPLFEKTRCAGGRYGSVSVLRRQGRRRRRRCALPLADRRHRGIRY